jgi:hypothetical protein
MSAVSDVGGGGRGRGGREVASLAMIAILLFLLFVIIQAGRGGHLRACVFERKAIAEATYWLVGAVLSFVVQRDAVATAAVK